MISTINMSTLIDVESHGQSTVPLESRTLLCAWKRFDSVAFGSARCSALDFLLLSLAFAGDKDLAVAWLGLLASEWSVTRCLIWMTADLLLFATRLVTSLASSIFALALSMALLATEMHSALQLLSTDIATTDITKPALLILEGFLPAHAHLGCKEWALRACVFILMAVVSNLRMTAALWSFAGISARRWLSAAW